MVTTMPLWPGFPVSAIRNKIVQKRFVSLIRSTSPAFGEYRLMGSRGKGSTSNDG
jgi:hypothetical protein